MRDLLMLGVTLGMVPLALMNGFVAFLLWIYINLLSPQAYLYGFMMDFRYVFMYAVVALAALMLGRLKDRAKFLADTSMVLIIIFIVHSLIAAFLSPSSNSLVAYRSELFIKGMALCVVAPFFINSRWRIHLTIVAIVAGLGFHGVVDGLKMISSAGAHIVRGIPNSTLTDNNLYALGIVMLLPLTLYLAKYSTSQLARWGALSVFGLCVMAVLGSNSRGGFVALAILGVWYWVTSPRKLKSTLLIVIVAIGVVQFAPPRFFDRMETIKEADQDASFLGRVAAWKVSVNIANDHPLFGAGFDSTQVKSIWDQYKFTPNFIDINIPESIGYKAAHSNYFQVLGDSGYVGLLIFLSLMASAFMTRWRVKALASKRPVEFAWALDLSTSINLSLVAFMVGGAAVSLAYFELVYLQIVLLSVIHRLLQEQIKATPSYTASSTKRGVMHV